MRTMRTKLEGSNAGLTNRRRELRLSDLLLLTAATAMGCGLALALNRATGGEIQEGFEALSSLFQIRAWQDLRSVLEVNMMGSYLLGSLVTITLPFAMVWTLAIVPPLLTGPRPRLRRLATQPGFMAACAFGVSIADLALPIGVRSVLVRVLRTPDSSPLDLDGVLFDLPMQTGAAVAAAWLTLILGRRWRARSDWTDRLGRIMGAYWILAGISTWVAWNIQEMVTTPGFAARWIDPPLTVWLGQKIFDLVKLTMPLLFLVMLGLSVRTCLLAWPFSRGQRDSSLATRPGTMAGVVTIMTMITLWLPVLAWSVIFGASWEDYRYLMTDYYFDDDTIVGLAAQFGGLTILVSWMTLYLGRQWRAKPTWTDRLGRGFGFLWILTGLAVTTSRLLIGIH